MKVRILLATALLSIGRPPRGGAVGQGLVPWRQGGPHGAERDRAGDPHRVGARRRHAHRQRRAARGTADDGRIQGRCTSSGSSKRCCATSAATSSDRGRWPSRRMRPGSIASSSCRRAPRRGRHRSRPPSRGRQGRSRSAAPPAGADRRRAGRRRSTTIDAGRGQGPDGSASGNACRPAPPARSDARSRARGRRCRTEAPAHTPANPFGVTTERRGRA